MFSLPTRITLIKEFTNKHTSGKVTVSGDSDYYYIFSSHFIMSINCLVFIIGFGGGLIAGRDRPGLDNNQNVLQCW